VAELIVIQFWVWTQVGPKITRWGRDSFVGMGTFEGDYFGISLHHVEQQLDFTSKSLMGPFFN